jgi:hypothetical protein
MKNVVLHDGSHPRPIGDQLELAILNGQVLGDQALQTMQESRNARALTSVASIGTVTDAAGSQ